MTSIAEHAHAGQAGYTARTLKIYDAWVLGVSNRWIWKCPTDKIQALYDQHITDNHLDVGVGTGYYLDRCRFPSGKPRVALMDFNDNSLSYCARRISRYVPEVYRRNVLEPIPFEGSAFDSVAVCYLLHCLPGAIREKAVIWDHLLALMKPGAVLFGATLLQGGVPRSWAARRLMDAYTAKGIFSNQRDDLEGLEQGLSERFERVSIEVLGCGALFSAYKKG